MLGPPPLGPLLRRQPFHCFRQGDDPIGDRIAPLHPSGDVLLRDTDDVRQPLWTMSEANENRLRQVMQKYGLIK